MAVQTDPLAKRDIVGFECGCAPDKIAQQGAQPERLVIPGEVKVGEKIHT